MSSTVVAARVDSKVKSRADFYIEKAGSSQAEVIRAVWLAIAQTGEVPGAENGAGKPTALSERMRDLRSRTPRSQFLEKLSPSDLKEELGKRE